MPKVFLRVEGFVVMALAIIMFVLYGYSFLWFALLFLAPDISMGGYLINPKVGAITYNLGHTYMLPVLVVAVTYLVNSYSYSTVFYVLVTIWFAHIGFDRMLGYGLKYGDSFNHTHLGMIGKKPKK